MGYSIPAGNEAPALLSGKPRPLGRGKRLIVTGIVIALGLAIDVCLWLWTFTVLTNCEVGWRTMLPGAVLGATGLEVLKALGAIWLPRTVASSSEDP